LLLNPPSMTSIPSPPPDQLCRGRYDLIIFDFDGTLADSFLGFVEAMEDAVRVFKYRSIPREELPAIRRKSAREIMKLLGVRWWQLPRLSRHLRQHLAASRSRIQLFPGIDSMLEELSAMGLHLALVTSNSEENVRAILGERLAGLFETYECGTSLFGKASRFRKVRRRFKIPKDRVLCIGDERRDAEAAHTAGLPFGAVAWGYAEAETLVQTRPRHLFREICEIRTAIENTAPVDSLS
jgi:phosphoglycolate phosphatase